MNRPRGRTRRWGAASCALALALVLGWGFPVRGETGEAFYADGKLKARFQTRPDGRGGSLRHGTFLRFYPGGTVALQGFYRDDEPIGIWSWWDETGNLMRRVKREGRFEELLSGEGFERPTTIFRDPNGTPVAEGMMKNNKGHGRWIYWYGNGTLRAEGNFLSGVPDGKWVTFHPNGQIKKLVEYRMGIPHGFFLAGLPNGEDGERGHMNQGLREGVWRFSHANGQRRAEGRFLQDLREGEWHFWDRNGEPMRHIVFHQGKMVREIPLPREKKRVEVVPNPETLVDRPRVFTETGEVIPFRFPGEGAPGQPDPATGGEDLFEKPWERLRR